MVIFKLIRPLDLTATHKVVQNEAALQNKDIPLRKVSWSGMKKAPEHIAARSISLISQNLDKRRGGKKKSFGYNRH